ncbi:MAG: hypothetical protein GC159_17320 [Phycisphaera sp.]|nr:hypothetical protein [Phycisphaera sp.]
MAFRATLVLFLAALICGLADRPVAAQDADDPFADLNAAAPEPAPAAKQPMSLAEAKEMVASLFGQEIARVQQTTDPADDLALSQTLLTAAQGADQDRTVVAVLSRYVAELAANGAEGWPTVQTALGLLGKTAPDQVADTLGEVVDTLQRRYNMLRGDERTAVAGVLLDAIVAQADTSMLRDNSDAALALYRRAFAMAGQIRPETRDAIKPKMNEAVERQRVTQKIDLLKNKLKANSKDTVAARELILAYVTDLDQPDEARKYTFLVDDAELAENLRRAYTPLDTLEEDDAFRLGEWYRSLSTSVAGDVPRARMLTHASNAYQRYLELHTAEDLYATRVKLSLKQIEESLNRLGAPVPIYASNVAGVATLARRGEWVDLLNNASLDSPLTRYFAKSANGVISDGAKGYQDGVKFVVPVVFDGDYDLEMTLAKSSGPYVWMFLPLSADGSRYVGLSLVQIDRGGLYKIDGFRVKDRENPTVKPTPIRDGMVNKLAIGVRQRDGSATITVTVDGVKWIDWSGPAASIEGSGSATPQFVSLYTHNAVVEVRSLRARAVSGTIAEAPKPTADEVADADQRPGKSDRPGKPGKLSKLEKHNPAAHLSPKAQQVFENWETYSNKQKLQLLDAMRSGSAEDRELMRLIQKHYRF